MIPSLSNQKIPGLECAQLANAIVAALINVEEQLSGESVLCDPTLQAGLKE